MFGPAMYLEMKKSSGKLPSPLPPTHLYTHSLSLLLDTLDTLHTLSTLSLNVQSRSFLWRCLLPWNRIAERILCTPSHPWFIVVQLLYSGMKRFAELTEEAKQAIETQDHAKLADLMDANFE